MNAYRPSRFCVAIALVAALASVSLLHGQQVVAKYDFANTGTQNSIADVDLATASALNLSAAGGRVATAGPDTVAGSYAKTQQSPNVIPGSLTEALSTAHYLGFTVTPDTALNVLSLDFYFTVSNATTSVDPYTGYWGVFTSETGWNEANLIQSGSLSRAKSTGVGATWGPVSSVDLSGISALQNLSTAVEIRIYYWDNSTTATSNLVVRFDDIALTAAAIPEPGTYAALFGVAALGLALWRRRRVAS